MKPIKCKKTQSSLLIPKKFLDVYKEKTKNSKREVYFHTVIKRYKTLVMDGFFSKSGKVKISYQDEGQDLVKVNFRPFNPDWIELGILSNWLVISRTALFTLLLILEFADFDIILREKIFEHGVPPKVSTIQLKIIQSRLKVINWKRQLRYKMRQ